MYNLLVTGYSFILIYTCGVYIAMGRDRNWTYIDKIKYTLLHGVTYTVVILFFFGVLAIVGSAPMEWFLCITYPICYTYGIYQGQKYEKNGVKAVKHGLMYAVFFTIICTIIYLFGWV